MTVVQAETIVKSADRVSVNELIVTAVEETLADAYGTILNYDLKNWPDTKIITVRCTDAANGLKYSVYSSVSASPGDNDWITLVGAGGETAEQTVAAASIDYQSTTLPWRHVKVDCKNAVGGNNSSVKVEVRSVVKAG